MRRWFAVVSLLVGLLFLAVGVVTTTGLAESSSPIKVGLATMLSGPLPKYGKAVQMAAELAVEEINAEGGINGRPVELIVRDVAADPTKAITAFQELSDRQNIDLFLMGTSTGQGLAVSPYVAEAKIPTTIIPFGDELTASKYPYNFRVCIKNSYLSEAAIHYVVDVRGIEKIAVFGALTGYSETAVNNTVELLKKRGIEPLTVQQASRNATSVDAQLRAIEQSGAKAVITWTYATSLHAHLLNARYQRDLVDDLLVVGHPTLGASATGDLLDSPDAWERVYAVNFTNTSYVEGGSLPPKARKFQQQLLDKHGEIYSLWWHATAYDGMYVFKEAVERAGGTDPEAIKQVLEATSKENPIPGVLGDYYYSPEDHTGLHPIQDLRMVYANSYNQGVFKRAPGYED